VELTNLLYEQDGPVVTVTVNRPESLNALNNQTMRELGIALEAFNGDESAQVMIITGAGSKAFVAGADIKEMAGLDSAGAEAFSRMGHKLSLAMEGSSKAIIAAVNGFALGGGCELAMCCDFIVASDRARFGQPEVALGVIAGFGGTQRLARLTGRGVAARMLMTGEMIKAQRAVEIGLATEVVPADQLMARVQELAQTIASKGPLAVGATKRALNRGFDLTMEAGLDLEAVLFGTMFNTDDMREGTNAFVESRPPNFVGR